MIFGIGQPVYSFPILTMSHHLSGNKMNLLENLRLVSSEKYWFLALHIKPNLPSFVRNLSSIKFKDKFVCSSTYSYDDVVGCFTCVTNAEHCVGETGANCNRNNTFQDCGWIS